MWLLCLLGILFPPFGLFMLVTMLLGNWGINRSIRQKAAEDAAIQARWVRVMDGLEPFPKGGCFRPANRF